MSKVFAQGGSRKAGECATGYWRGTDPYGAGWLTHVALADFAADRAALLHGDTVAAAMAAHAWLFRVDDS